MTLLRCLPLLPFPTSLSISLYLSLSLSVYVAVPVPGYGIVRQRLLLRLLINEAGVAIAIVFAACRSLCLLFVVFGSHNNSTNSARAIIYIIKSS